MNDDEYITVNIHEILNSIINATQLITIREQLVRNYETDKKRMKIAIIIESCILIISLILISIYFNLEPNYLIPVWLILNLFVMVTYRSLIVLEIFRKFKEMYSNPIHYTPSRFLRGIGISLLIISIINFALKIFGTYIFFSNIIFTPLSSFMFALLIMGYFGIIYLIMYTVKLFCVWCFSRYLIQHRTEQAQQYVLRQQHLQQEVALLLILSMFDIVPQNTALSEEQISNLPTFKYKKNNQTENCSICLVEFQDDDDIFDLQCKHKFHRICGSSWFKINANCPNCRMIINK